MFKNQITNKSFTSRADVPTRILRSSIQRQQSRCHSQCSRRRRVAFFLLAALLPVISKADFSHQQQVDATVLAEMKKQKIVGAAIGIIQNSQIVYTQGYGLSDLQTGTQVTDETVFNWASNSKPLIAIAALQLVQSQTLDLDKSIDSYLPQLPPQFSKLTCRQLLCHQSGIPHYSIGQVISTQQRLEKTRPLNPAREIDPDESLNRFILSPLLFTPGRETSYSSYAYVLLTAVVQAAGNEPIGTQLRDRIIRPLKLNSFQLDLPDNQQSNWTKGYKIENGKHVVVTDYAHFWKHGAGGYKSNVKDFATFASALADSRLLQKSMSTKMWTQQTTIDGKQSNYGLGVVVTGSGETIKISHNGSQDETRTRMVIYPHLKHGIVVMSNTQGSDPGKITTAIYSTLRGQRHSRADGN